MMGRVIAMAGVRLIMLLTLVIGMRGEEEEESLLVHLLRRATWVRLLDPNSNRLPV